jgi:hypothetical protein
MLLDELMIENKITAVIGTTKIIAASRQGG